MSKHKWEVKTHEEKPNWGEGDYDEYYEVVNERGDSLQTSDNFEALHLLADLLNAFPGELRITTALEINQHCEIMELKAENDKMRKALEESVSIIRQWHGESAFDIYYQCSPEMKPVREALKTNTHG